MPSPDRTEDRTDNLGGEPLAFQKSCQAPAAYLRFESIKCFEFLVCFLTGDISLGSVLEEGA